MPFSQPRLLCSLVILLVGCQVSPEAYRDLEPAGDTLRAERPGGHVDLDAEHGPNPIGVATVSAQSERYIGRHFPGLDPTCDGFVAPQPAMVLRSSTPLEEVKIRAGGDAELLVIQGPKGSTYCDDSDGAPTLTIAEGEAGVYRIYTGRRGRHESFEYEVLVEDQRAALTIPWTDDDSIATITITDEFDEVINTSAQTYHGDYLPVPPLMSIPDCFAESVALHHRPPIRLEVKDESPITVAALAEASPSLLVLGPVTADGRDSKTVCLPHRVDDLVLDPGDYFFYLGAESTGQPDTVDLLIYGPDSSVEPTDLIRRPDQSLPPLKRALQSYYPFLSLEDLWRDEALRSHFFQVAPRELFVGLEGADGDVQIVTGTDGDDRFSYRSAAEGDTFPAGEIALLIDQDGHVLTADGLILSVSTDRLAGATEVETPVVPQQPRSARLDLSRSLSFATRDDRDWVRDYRRRHQNFQICSDDIYAAADSEIDALEEAGKSSSAIDELVDQTERDIRRECDYRALQQADDELHDALQESHLQRRQEALERNAQHIDELFH